jgi:hypothetical protein
MSLGYEDTDAPVNGYRTPRDDVASFTRFFDKPDTWQWLFLSLPNNNRMRINTTRLLNMFNLYRALGACQGC